MVPMVMIYGSFQGEPCLEVVMMKRLRCGIEEKKKKKKRPRGALVAAPLPDVLEEVFAKKNSRQGELFSSPLDFRELAFGIAVEDPSINGVGARLLLVRHCGELGSFSAGIGNLSIWMVLLGAKPSKPPPSGSRNVFPGNPKGLMSFNLIL